MDKFNKDHKTEIALTYKVLKIEKNHATREKQDAILAKIKNNIQIMTFNISTKEQDSAAGSRFYFKSKK